MGYEWKVCYEQLTKGGMTPCDGSSLPYHCTDFQETTAYHNCCAQTAIYQPVQAILCKNKATGEVQFFKTEECLKKCWELSKENPNWNVETCYCCCSCFANDTMIETPDGNVEVQEIEPGSKILVGSLAGNGNHCCVWEEKQVTFSNGTETGEQPSMVYVVYGENQELIVSPDHVFMLDDGSFITARYLYPGDRFVDKEGNPVDIITASIGHYKGGVHHISADTDFQGTVDGHLILSGGIISGDFTLQMNYESLKYADTVKKERFSLDSPEYLAAFKNRIFEKGIYYFCDKKDTLKENKRFLPYDLTEGLTVPSGAYTLFSPEQENDIFTRGTQFPVSTTIGYGGALYVIKLFKGFYPDVDIRLEWKLRQPNMYVFLKKGCKTVVISGGLVRMQGLNAEGLALLAAMCVGRFYGEEGSEICGRGKAEFYAASAITRGIWYGNMWMNPIVEALKQVTALFSLITPENAMADEDDPQEGLSVSCRLDNLNSGIVGGSMPVCAGGKEKPKLRLQRAAETEYGVRLTFNLEVRGGAEESENYTFTPSAEVTEIKPDPNKRFCIDLAVSLEKNVEYTISVKNMISVHDTDLEPDYAFVKVLRD